ncbi:succinyl-diaminopimelate desuccinylase [Shumkonia mesophila]|uniref:succinyl-diaminopimelate desuccinylase n=1 Tax=Shumkonia mesophila TaxID=2838854 RepID=UPI002934246C|nr:succinyl-diaminopimelate desuccinylase [Shumkonia mesophila]
MAARLDPVDLTRALVRCPSVTPSDAGALAVLEGALVPLGFTCHRLKFSQAGTPDVDNLYARLGTGRPHFCFAGHTDVVPPGDVGAWSAGPFAGEVIDGRLIGRGTVDMKGAIGAFVAAAAAFLEGRRDGFKGSISLLITGDEEGPAINGTVKVLEWMKAKGEIPDHCLVGEPTNREALGETVKIGRRGSLNALLTVYGTQGHTAYPQHADNPIRRLMRMLTAIADRPLDEGTAHFEPSRAEVTSIDVGNPTTNLIPGKVTARFNVRFNDRHSGESLKAWIGQRCAEVGGRFDLACEVSGESFLCPPGPWTDRLATAIRGATGRTPALDTGGGTSDARFIRNLCPVAEFGLSSATGHKVDEAVTVADLVSLTEVYRRLLAGYFADPPCPA